MPNDDDEEWTHYRADLTEFVARLMMKKMGPAASGEFRETLPAILLRGENAGPSSASGAKSSEAARGFTPDITASSIPVSVDTLHLGVQVSRAMIRRDHQLRVWGKKSQKRFLLWEHEDGEIVEGTKAVWHGDGVHVEIKRVGGGAIWCFVHFSLSGLARGGDNTWPARFWERGEALDKVQTILTRIGVDMDVWQATICRCDPFRILPMEEPEESYRKLFPVLSMPGGRQSIYPTGTRSSNNSQALLLYEKNAERKDHGRPEADLPPSLLRVEWRLMGAETIRERLGVGTPQQLLENWHMLEFFFVACVNTSWFMADPIELVKLRPLKDKRGVRPTHSELQNLVRWCTSKQIPFTLTPTQLDALLEADGIEGYRSSLQPIARQSPQCARRVGKAVSQMREALLRECLRDPAFFRKWEELRCKLQSCWMWRNHQPGSPSSAERGLSTEDMEAVAWVMGSPVRVGQHQIARHDRIWAQAKARTVVVGRGTWCVAQARHSEAAEDDDQCEMSQQ